MSGVKENPENRAIHYLEEVVKISIEDRDALPGSAVKHIKEALTILRKRKRKDTPRRKDVYKKE